MAIDSPHGTLERKNGSLHFGRFVQPALRGLDLYQEL